jgi:cytochrome c oxidase subunit 2
MMITQVASPAFPFWMPPNAAAHGFALDRLMHWNLFALTACFVLAHLLLAIVFLRRPKADAERGAPRRWKLQFVPVTLFGVMYLAMAITAQRLWALNRFEGASLASMQVEVTGRQFQWYFRYPGPDATFGRTDPALINPANGNPLGLLPNDDHGHDDIVASELVLPVDREVDLTLRAQDVIHGFFIPAMRLKQNAVPGQSLHVHFTPVATGIFPILCTQVCGLGHARMQARLRVVSYDEFQKWLQGKSAVAAQ